MKETEQSKTYSLLGIEMSFEEFDHLICEQNKGKKLITQDGKICAVNYEISQKEQNEQAIAELKQKLSDTDYIANKLAEAISKYIVTEDKTIVSQILIEYSEELQQREQWRNEINKLEESISKLK